MCGRDVRKLGLALAVGLASAALNAQTQTPVHVTADGITQPETHVGNVLQANQAARTFRRHDERSVREQAFIHDDKEYVDSAAKAIRSLEELLLGELDGQTNVGDSAWDSASRRREVGRSE